MSFNWFIIPNCNIVVNNAEFLLSLSKPHSDDCQSRNKILLFASTKSWLSVLFSYEKWNNLNCYLHECLLKNNQMLWKLKEMVSLLLILMAPLLFEYWLKYSWFKNWNINYLLVNRTFIQYTNATKHNMNKK